MVISVDTYITIGGIVFSLGGAWFLVHRQGEDIKSLWKVIQQTRNWEVSHTTEANEHRIRFIQEIGRIERDAVTKEEMRRNFEKFDEKLDRMAEKLDRLIQHKGNSD